jgi:hypothetical protein
MNATATQGESMKAVVVGAAARGPAGLFTLECKTTVYFQNDLIANSQVVVSLDQTYDSIGVGSKVAVCSDELPSGFSVCLFINDDMVASGHRMTWEQAMACILAALSARTVEEVAGSCGLLPCDPDWESKLDEPELAAHAGA